MSYYSYLILPFFTWLFTGSLKFLINSIRAKKFAIDLIGYGGMPSNHSAIASSIVFLIALKEGIDHPAFGVGLAFCFLTLIDANGLRRRIGQQAQIINQLAKNDNPLRERMGHTKIEILAGIATGCFCTWLIKQVMLF